MPQTLGLVVGTMPPKYKSTHKRTRGSKGQFNKAPTPTSSSSNSSEESNDTGFISDSKDDENLWEVEKIVDERKGQYKVKWAGINPDTGKAWDLDWVNKRDCTDGLVEEWKWRKTREAEIGSGRGRGKGRGGGRGGKGKGVSRGDGRGVSGERKSGEVGTSAAGVSFSRSESGGKSMSVEKDKGKGKEKENVVVRNDNRWGSVGKRKVTEVGMMQGTAKGNGKGKEREVVEPEESSTEEGSEDEDNEIERNITTKKQYIEKLKEEEEESEGSQAGSALDDNTAVRRRETPENPPYDSEQGMSSSLTLCVQALIMFLETGSHSPEVRSPSPQVSKLPLRIGPPRGVKRKVEIDAGMVSLIIILIYYMPSSLLLTLERPRAKKAKTTQQILTPATSSCNVAIGKIGPPRRAMAHTDSGSSKAGM